MRERRGRARCPQVYIQSAGPSDNDADCTPDRIYTYEWTLATFMGYYTWD